MAEPRGLAAADAVVLCGGMGRRLRAAVADRPKPLADLDGRPFLDILLDQVSGFGPSRFILCAGYMGDRIQRYAASAATAGREVLVSLEDRPLGTAGALRQAAPLIRSSPFLVLNGDSLCRADLGGFWDFHLRHGGAASVVLSPPEAGTDYGAVSRDAQGRIRSFSEKTGAAPGQLINAGIYLFAAEVLDRIPAGPAWSLERDLLPDLARAGAAWGWAVRERVMDIGTPQRYAAAKRRLRPERRTGG